MVSTSNTPTITLGLSHPWKKSGSDTGSERYDCSRLARRPLGGSEVILMPFCSTATGKDSEGYEVSHRRKRASVASGDSCSHSRSSVAIHDSARWQFCSTTQKPSARPAAMSLSAAGPCPCPSEMDSTRVPRRSASLRMGVMGSAPGERTKMRGERDVESWKHASRLKGGGSTNLAPITPSTYSRTAKVSLSGRMVRRASSCWKRSRRVFQGAGSSWETGSEAS